MFQSTPPRGRRLGILYPRRLVYDVSIHASAWEATGRFPGGAKPLYRFQSTPPRGRRRCAQRSFVHIHQVSIHASAWEATRSIPLQFPDWSKFQSTPPRGRRHYGGCMTLHEALFQSTPPRGRRRPAAARRSWIGRFNPRLRVGGDSYPRAGIISQARVSIHASAWEATTGFNAAANLQWVSIHASAWEATP